MSNIQTTLYRSQDHRMLKIQLSLDFKKPYEYATVSFKCEDQKLEVTSTSTGSIDQEGNVRLSTSLNSEMYVEYCEISNNLECLVGFYNANELVYYEALVASFDNTKNITGTPILIPHIGTIPGSHNTRFADFREALKRRKSSWQISMTCPDDVLLTIDKAGKNLTLVCLGETTNELASSDFVFQIDPFINHLNVPKSLLRKNYDLYTPGCSLGIFELIKPDFLGVKNVFYKVLISNTLSLSSFANEL